MMNKTLSLMVSVLLCAGYAGAAENPWAAYRCAPDALKEMDLASDTDWTLSVDGGAPRPIKVTAGGWNSDQQDPQIPSADVKDCAIYERSITIPAEAKGQVVKILFGGCNYGAEVFLDDQKITEHHAPMTPFEADVTAVAKPGQTQRLKVKSYTRYHYGKLPQIPVGFDFNKGMSRIKWPFEGDTKFAYGLTGYVRLALYPAVYLKEVFVRPSVSGKSLAYDVWIANGSATEREVVLKGGLSSWDKRTWPYPALPERTVRLKAGEVQKVTVEGVPWTLGPQSYWWPNIPFREDYQATLHWLNLTLEEAGKPLHELRQRFGFVEYQEGPFYYTVNGVRFSGFGDCNSYGQVGEYDCWTETPAFQPPHGEFKGCSETWKRYQRIGFNSMRLSTSVPTRYMLETADEAGFMLIPEGGNWGGNGGMGPNSFTNFMVQVQETIRVARNHPCIPRYSLANESLRGPLDDPRNPWRPLVDAALEVDSTRPLVYECNYNQSGVVPGMKSGKASVAEHYMPIFPSHDRIRSMGETTWATDGMAAFTGQALAMRMNDWAYFASWSWLNYWPNFLEGMNAERHPWKYNDYGDRKDGVDGWGSPSIQAVQWALHPYLVIDRGLLEFNPTIKENSKAGKMVWPYRLPVYEGGAKVERQIELFNNSLSTGNFTVKWAAHWDSPAGAVVAQGEAGPLKIEAGCHATQTVAFDAPNPEREDRTLYLVLESVKDGERVMRDERSRLTVTKRALPASAATFIEMDKITGAAWNGKYGQQGYWLAGAESKLPGDVKVDATNIVQKIWEKETSEPRVPAGEEGKRVAAGWEGAQRYLTFTLDVGDTPRKISLYFYIWKQRDWTWQTVMIRSMDGRLLDERRMDHFKDGCYLSWKIKGRVQVEIQNRRVCDGFFSGLFVD